eukprot:1089499-Lingulodinium_polyedra.AAC.1
MTAADAEAWSSSCAKYRKTIHTSSSSTSGAAASSTSAGASSQVCQRLPKVVDLKNVSSLLPQVHGCRVYESNDGRT